MSFTIDSSLLGQVIVRKSVALLCAEQHSVFKKEKLDYSLVKKRIRQFLSSEDLISAGDGVYYLPRERWIFLIQEGYLERIAPLPGLSDHARDRLLERSGAVTDHEQNALLAYDLMFCERSWHDQQEYIHSVTGDRIYVLSPKGDTVVTIKENSS